MASDSPGWCRTINGLLLWPTKVAGDTPLMGLLTSGTDFHIKSQNHGTAWLEGTFKCHQFPNLLGWAGTPSTSNRTETSSKSMNNSRNGTSIISLGNLCQAPFLSQDCNQLLPKIGRTALPFMAYIFLESKIIPRFKDCTTGLFSTISRATIYHQGTPNFSEMAKSCHNRDKNIN